MVNQPDVPPHDLRKRALRPFIGIASEQFGFVVHGVTPLSPADSKTGQNKSF
jgi:hypothetical protein